VGGDRVHVALDHDDPVGRAGRILGEVEAVDEGALVEDGGLRELRYLGWSSPMARAPKPTTRPSRVRIGNIRRFRNRS
jgi:hypothetical protein